MAPGLVEEELQLALGRGRGIAAVHEVLGDEEPVVAADRPGWRGRGVRRPHHRAPDVDGPLALEARDDDRARRDERDEVPEEGLLAVLAVVLLGQRAVDPHEPHLGDPKSLAFDAPEHLADQAAADAVRLHDEQGRLDGHLQGSSSPGPRLRTSGGAPATSARRASATVYREPVTRMRSPSPASARAASSAPRTFGKTCVATPLREKASATSSAGRARTLVVAQAKTSSASGAMRPAMPSRSLFANTPTTRRSRSHAKASGSAAVRASAAAGLCAPSSTISGCRPTTSSRPGTVAPANAPRTASSSRARSKSASTAATA